MRILKTIATLATLLPAAVGSQGITRPGARALLEASLSSAGIRWMASSGCPHELWDGFQDNRPYLSRPIEVTGIADGPAGTKLATFKVRLTGLQTNEKPPRKWVEGDGIASFRKWDDGWRLSAANIESCAWIRVTNTRPSAANPKAPAAGGPIPNSDAARKAGVEAMTADLNNLMTAQEAYFADHNGKYATTVGALGRSYRTSSGVTITLHDVSSKGWQATATHQATAITCEISPQDSTANWGMPMCRESVGSGSAESRQRIDPVKALVGTWTDEQDCLKISETQAPLALTVKVWNCKYNNEPEVSARARWTGTELRGDDRILVIRLRPEDGRLMATYLTPEGAGSVSRNMGPFFRRSP